MLEMDKVYKLNDDTEIQILKFIDDFRSDKRYAVILHNKCEYICDLEYLNNAILTPNRNKHKRTTEEKIKLYRSYFRGNNDVVADSFLTKEGKMVYFPWCHIRKKFPCPKVKKPKFQCSMCNVHSFQKMTDEVIFNHLKGVNKYNKEVMYGMYPIVDSDKTYILAFDFDKKDWTEEIKNVTKVIQSLEIDYLIEISQSGNGAHIWIFFEDKILARKARELGNIILTQAMKNYPELSFESFDRMFPNQNEVSKGGFGNLIALPLQGKRVLKGCSRFTDDNLMVIDDIWDALENTKKINEEYVNRITEKYSKELPIDYYKAEHEKNNEQKALFEHDKEYSRNEINIIKEAMIKIKISELTKKELVKLKFLSSFHNKAYYKALNKRLNTKNIPRIITLSEIEGGYIKLPRGLINQLLEIFPNANIIDRCSAGKQIEVDFKSKLYESQELALEKLIQYDNGLLCAGTGFGKTVVACKLIADKSISTLIIVNSKNLAKQWKAQLEMFINLSNEPYAEYTPKGRLKKKDKIGIIYGGKISRSKNVDIALFQSLSTIEDIKSIIDDYGMVIVDEAHHVAAKTFEDVMSKVTSQYVYGLTATPTREDGLENIIYLRIGPIRHVVEKEVPKHITQKLYLRFTSSGEHISNIQENLIHDNNDLILNDDERNNMILEDINECIDKNRHIIVLSRYVEHIQILKAKFEKMNKKANSYILNSHMKTSKLRDEMNELKTEGKPFVLFTTGSYAGEGFDLPVLDTLMLIMPIKAKGNVKQYLGRLLRNLYDKEELRVYDYVDYAIPMFYKMYLKRMRTYKSLGYTIEENTVSNLYQSTIIEGNYKELLSKDIYEAEEYIVVVSFLSMDIIEWLISIQNKSSSKKTIVISKKTKNIMKKRLDILIENGYNIEVIKSLSNNFVILNKKLVWMISNIDNCDLQNDISLRLFSKEIAEKLIKNIENYK